MASVKRRNTTKSALSTATLRVASYRRVSMEEQVEGYSLDAQVRAVRQYCQDHDWRIVQEYADEGRSARTDDLARRPAFAQMLVDAETGCFDVIVVHKLDRFARNLRVTVETLERLNRAGVAFVSITEQLDFTTPQGKLFLHMLAALAQFYSDNLSQETSKGKQERRRQGLYNGLLPFGVVKDDATKLPVPDRRPLENGLTNFDGLVLAFREAAAGATDAQVGAKLNAAGFRTTGNRGQNLWQKDSVRVLLRNRFYLGELPGGIKGQHAPIVDDKLFAAVQATRYENQSSHASRSVATSHTVYSLSGLLRCAYCGGKVLIGNQRGVARTACRSRRQGLECQQRGCAFRAYEEPLERWLYTIPWNDAVGETERKATAEQEASAPDPEHERRRLKGRLKRLGELYCWGSIEQTEYRLEADQIKAKLATLQGAPKPVKPTAETVKTIGELWARLPGAKRNELAARLFSQIVVRDDQIVQIVPRPNVSTWLPAWGDGQVATLTSDQNVTSRE